MGNQLFRSKNRRQRKCFLLSSPIIAGVLIASAHIAWAEDTPTPIPDAKVEHTADGPVIPADASEEFFIDNIKRLNDAAKAAQLQPIAPTNHHDQRSDLLVYLDEFIKRYPHSSFRDDALIIKLSELASYSRVQPLFLRELFELNEQIAKSKPSERLADENDYYSVQAFIMGARDEHMPDDRRIEGAIERYEAFLADHQKSEHRPIIWASLIRNQLALKKNDQAAAELAKMQKAFPDHAATKRAAGEVVRAHTVGKPYAFRFTTPEGQSVETKQFHGKVVLIHFWAGWSEVSINGLPELIALNDEFKDQGLQLIGVNVDKHRRLMVEALEKHKMPWPQYYDEKGFENDILVGSGVIQLPTYFVIDRTGVLRSTDPGEHLKEMIKDLLAKPAPTP